ncbi:MAG: hypothetical protein K6E85_13265 [Lachnospiraceae bacterium]|nr:hypothetical protein [Lachnospiraceae bacterium]
MVIYVNDSGVFRSDNNAQFNSASQVNRIEKLKNVNSDTGSVIRDTQKAYVAENTPAYNISISSAGRAAVQSLKVFNDSLSKISANTGNSNFGNLITSNLKNGFGSTLNEPRTGSYTDRYLDNTDKSVTGIYDIQQSNVKETSAFTTNTSEDVNVSLKSETPQAISAEPSQVAANDYDADSATSSNVNPNNLTRYSEFQLRQMVLEGSITSSDMNSELDKRASSSGLRIEPSQEAMMKQAVAAYDYQMAYQINSVLTQ